MAQHTWLYDAPTGTYKQHAMSQQLFEAAVEDSIFIEHTRPVDGFGAKKGENVTLTRVANITEPTSAVLDETQRIAEDDFSLSTTSVTVQELGRAVPFTSLSEDLSEFNLENPIQKKLRQQMALTLDTLAAAAFTGCQIKWAVTGLTSYTVATAGSFGATSSDNLSVYQLEEIRDYLYDTLYG